ncbi:MAG: hypothetical protein AAGJ79_11345 [Verrucomicrobiota bacterium]
MSFKPFMGKMHKDAENSWWKLGLRSNMEIVEINGCTDDWTLRQVIAWFRLNHKAGDEVCVKVKAGGQTMEFVRRLPPHCLTSR